MQNNNIRKIQVLPHHQFSVRNVSHTRSMLCTNKPTKVPVPISRKLLKDELFPNHDIEIERTDGRKNWFYKVTIRVLNLSNRLSICCQLIGGKTVGP